MQLHLDITEYLNDFTTPLQRVQPRQEGRYLIQHRRLIRGKTP